MSILNTLPQATTSDSDATSSVRKRGKAPKQVELLQLASAAGRFETKKASRDALKAGGFISTPEVIEKLLVAAEYIASERKTRRSRVTERRLGHIPSQVPAMQTTKPVLLPGG